MAAEKHTTDDKLGHDGQTQNRTRGTLESDCAVVVPASSTTVSNYHTNVTVARQNLDFCEMAVSDEVDEDTEPMNSSMKDASTTFQLREDLTQSNPCVSTARPVSFSPNAVTLYAPSFGLTARSVAMGEIETDVNRLRVKDQHDELDENGDT